jgi:hypothetical protein
MKTLEQVLAEERKSHEEFEARTEHKGFKIADLRKAFNAVKNQADSRESWAASVPHQLVAIVLVAVEFFHADKAQVIGIEPITGHVLMQGNGYQAY